ncbi:MAG: RNA polymerase sigma factor [Phycisphaerae bacterium]|nr:RNA polymerase sigma factor [Phycisphaerae bacterium]
MHPERERGNPRRDLTPSLVMRLRAGDPEASLMLEQLYREPLIRFCKGYVGTVEAAEDIVQEVFYKVLATTDTPEKFRPWIYTIARHLSLNARRSRGRRRDREVLHPDAEPDADTIGNLSRLVREEKRSRIRYLIGTLTPAQREVLWLRYFETRDGKRLSRAEISGILDIPESVVKSRLYEAFKKLSDHISLLET